MDNEKRIIACIALASGADESSIKLDTTLDGALYMDILDKIELVMALEEEFEIEISDEEAGACETVADVVALVERGAA